MRGLLFRGWEHIPENQRRKGARVAFILVVSLCFAIGILLRIYGAWVFRHITDPDCGVVALMARHMAMGNGFPVFFYGQDYMGSLEPALSALFCKIIGISGFAVCLGPVLPACLTLFAIYLWGRDVGGKSAGLGALACVMIGPYIYFMFQMAPRGGYMVTVLLSTLIMWQSSRAAQRALDGHPLETWRAIAIGLLAGLGWWTNLLIVASLAASACVLLVCFRQPRSWRVFPIALIAFVLGGLPSWYWNATHGWPTFNMSSSLGAMPITVGFAHLWERCQRLVWLWHWPKPLGLAVIGFHFLLMCGGLAWGMARYRRSSGMHLVCMVLFIVISQALFVRSSFAAMNTARYLLPLVPVGAVLIGLAVNMLLRRAGLVAAVIPVLVCIISQLHVLPELRKVSAGAEPASRVDTALREQLRELNIEAAYATWDDYPLNFRLGEGVRITMLKGDRYAPQARAVEMAERIAILNNLESLGHFTLVCGGERRSKHVEGIRIDYALKPPRQELALIPGSGFEVLDDKRINQLAMLKDLNLDTYWRAETVSGSNAMLSVIFNGPQTVRMLRIIGPSRADYPEKLRVDIQREAGGPWETHFEAHPVTPYYWSGTRPFGGGPGYRLEYRFRDIQVNAIRIVRTDPTQANQPVWRVSEIQAFMPGGRMPGESQSLADLEAQLKIRGIRRLYCDRWIANRIHEDFAGEIEVMLSPVAFNDSPLPVGERMTLTPGSALLCLRHDVDSTRAVLRQFGFRMHGNRIGPWVLLEYQGRAILDNQWPSPRPPLLWAGFGCLRGHNMDYAQDLYDQGAMLMAEPGDVVQAQQMLMAAASAHPNIASVDKELFSTIFQSGPALNAPPRHGPFSDGHRVDAHFSGGIVLESLNLAAPSVRPGDTFYISYSWRRFEAVRREQLQVFVHFRNQGIQFQDDHRFLADLPSHTLKVLRHPELDVEYRLVRVPTDAPAGEYDVYVGLFNWKTSGRLKVSSELPVRRRAVIMEKALKVEG